MSGDRQVLLADVRAALAAWRALPVDAPADVWEAACDRVARAQDRLAAAEKRG